MKQAGQRGSLGEQEVLPGQPRIHKHALGKPSESFPVQKAEPAAFICSTTLEKSVLLAAAVSNFGKVMAAAESEQNGMKRGGMQLSAAWKAPN